MCKCTPYKRTPFCGAPGCEWPAPPQAAPAFPVFLFDRYLDGKLQDDGGLRICTVALLHQAFVLARRMVEQAATFAGEPELVEQTILVHTAEHGTFPSRLSADHNDRGYNPGIAPYVTIYLDDVELRDVITADVDEGCCVVLALTSEGKRIQLGNQLLRVTKRGRVEIRIKRCSVCNSITHYACADCAINTGSKVFVCINPGCRDKHEVVCTSPPRSV